MGIRIVLAIILCFVCIGLGIATMQLMALVR